MAIELAAYLERERPKRILEVGSGFSTAVLAAYAARHGAEVVTLEHMGEYHAITTDGLTSLGLNRHVDLRLAALKPQWFGNHGLYQWYEVSLEGTFDFVFVDGPPKQMGRRGVFFAVREHLKPGWQMWLDDGLRRHERQCIRLWEQRFPRDFSRVRLDVDGRGVFILRDAAGERDRGAELAILDRLAIAVLGNGDSNWWRRAKRNVGDELLGSSYVVVTAKDGTRASLPKFVDKHVPADRRPLRQRVQGMLSELASQPGVRYVLYLDDQWFPRTLDASWLSWALEILETQPEVEQVCLGHRIDEDGEVDGQGSAKPFTGVPSLLKADRLAGLVLPAAVKTRWQRITTLARIAAPSPSLLQTIQLSPGVFRRTNGNGHPAGRT